MRGKRKSISYIITAIVVASLGLLYSLNLNKPKDVVDETPLPMLTEEPVTYDNSMWIENKSVNEEYIGEIKFTSGLVDQHVVQAEDNEKYLKLSWDNQETTHGAVFMDYRNTLDDQNIIMYGHYVYKDESLIFGPLHELKDQEKYQDNKYIELTLDGEIRKYEVAYVYYYEMDNPTLEYFHTNYDQAYFDLYLKTVLQKQFYSTGVDIKMDDKLLTLQTCVRDRDDLRLIVVSKLIS